MKILIVNARAEASGGGAEKHVADLAAQLSAHGHELAFLHAFPGGEVLPGSPAYVLHPTDWRDDPRRRLANHLNDLLSPASPRLAAVVDRVRPDLVHTHNLPGIGTGIWEVARRAGVPVVHTLHDYFLSCPRVTLTRRDGSPCRPSPLLCGLRARRVQRWAGAVGEVVGVSRFILDLYAAVFPRAGRRVIRHPVVADSRPAPTPPRSELRTVGYIGALEAMKGVRVILEAAPELGRLGCELRLAGRGKLEQEVSAAAARWPHVRYDGFLGAEEKERFLAECDLGLVPSVWNEPGAPAYAMVEWLLAGRPVLVSRRGGLGEAIAGLPGSIAVEPTADDLVATIGRLRSRAGWERALAALGPIVVEDDLGRWTAEYEAAYEAALRRAAASDPPRQAFRRSRSA